MPTPITHLCFALLLLCSTIGDRAFAVAGPRSWNNLPVDLRLSRTFVTFKAHLKSHLFNLSFPSVWLYHWLFLYSALEAACAAYASLNLSLLDYITFLPASNITVMCKQSGALNLLWPNETFMQLDVTFFIDKNWQRYRLVTLVPAELNHRLCFQFPIFYL